MPSIESLDRCQTAVLWAWVGSDDYGEPGVAAPEEVEVRWESGRHEAVGPKGETIALDAKAVLPVSVPIDSLMWLGTLEDWYGTGSAGDDTMLMQVKTYQSATDVKGREERFEVGLQRFRNKPTG